MASSGGSTETSGLYVVVILLAFIVLRIRRIVNGTRISKARSIAFSIYYIAFASLLIAGSFFDGVSGYYGVIYLAIGVAGFYGAHRAINRRLVFWRGADGSVYAKGGIVIYLIYVVALIARLAIDLVYVPSALTFTFSSVPLGGTAVAAEIATDALLALGSGLLTGRNVRLYQRYVAIEQGKETIADSPTST
jgi:hypothetical protein